MKNIARAHAVDKPQSFLPDQIAALKAVIVITNAGNNAEVKRKDGCLLVYEVKKKRATI